MGAIRRTEVCRQNQELIMTAGRVFFISAPMVGSRFTNQISPRFGLAANEISAAHASYFAIAGVASAPLVKTSGGGCVGGSCWNCGFVGCAGIAEKAESANKLKS